MEKKISILGIPTTAAVANGDKIVIENLSDTKPSLETRCKEFGAKLKTAPQLKKAEAACRKTFTWPKVKRGYFNFCNAVGKLIKAYIVWVVLYTVAEHFAPGLVEEVSANLTRAWNEPITALEQGSYLAQVFAQALRIVEKIWSYIAQALPFIG